MSVLDPEYTSEVLFVLNELKRQGVQMILVTHEMGLARNACEKAAFLQSGVLVKWGEIHSLFQTPQTPQLRRFLGKYWGGITTEMFRQNLPYSLLI